MTRPSTPRDTVTTCPDCGWTSKRTTEGLAVNALRIHSCRKTLAETAATARYLTRMGAVDRTPKPCQHKITNHRHGTRAAYSLDTCRCLPCCTAMSDYEAARRRRHAYGTWDGLVDAEPARAHVRELQAAGMGIKRVAAAAGVSSGVMTKLLYGTATRPPARRILPGNAERLLAVPSPSIGQLGASVLVPAVGARRRVQALVALGWSTPGLAAAAGVDVQVVRRVLSGVADTCYARTHVQIDALYDRLWDQRPPETTAAQRWAASRSRRWAAACGWVPPLMWDDDAIDDPDAVPYLQVSTDPVMAAFVQDVRELVGDRVDPEVIAHRLGVTLGACEQRLRRYAPDLAALFRPLRPRAVS